MHTPKHRYFELATSQGGPTHAAFVEVIYCHWAKSVIQRQLQWIIGESPKGESHIKYYGDSSVPRKLMACGFFHCERDNLPLKSYDRGAHLG